MPTTAHVECDVEENETCMMKVKKNLLGDYRKVLFFLLRNDLDAKFRVIKVDDCPRRVGVRVYLPNFARPSVA